VSSFRKHTDAGNVGLLTENSVPCSNFHQSVVEKQRVGNCRHRYSEPIVCEYYSGVHLSVFARLSIGIVDRVVNRVGKP